SAYSYFFFNDTATTEIYTLSLHDALPIFALRDRRQEVRLEPRERGCVRVQDRKSTRLNSSHRCISYAVFCLKKTYRITRLVVDTTVMRPCTRMGARINVD